MGIPKECRMDDLSHLDTLTNRLIVQLLIGNPGLSKKAGLYRRNFIRIVDKALREYGQAREAVLADVAEANRSAKEMIKHGREMHFIAFTDHIENCINAVSRLFKLLERIKSKDQSPAWPRELRKLLETKSELIINARNAVEHIDTYIRNDEIEPGNPVMMTVSKMHDAVIVANYEIKFDELAMVIRKMHEVGQYILTIKKMK